MEDEIDKIKEIANNAHREHFYDKNITYDEFFINLNNKEKLAVAINNMNNKVTYDGWYDYYKTERRLNGNDVEYNYLYGILNGLKSNSDYPNIKKLVEILDNINKNYSIASKEINKFNSAYYKIRYGFLREINDFFK